MSSSASSNEQTDWSWRAYPLSRRMSQGVCWLRDRWYASGPAKKRRRVNELKKGQDEKERHDSVRERIEDMARRVEIGLTDGG